MSLSCPPPPFPQLLFDRAGIQLYWADSLTALPSLSFAADLIVTDPPYGVGWQSNYRSKEDQFSKIEGDESTDIALSVLKQAIRKLSTHRHAYVFGKFDLQPLGFASQVELIWDKTMMSMGNLSLPWGSQHEPIQFAAYYPHKEKGKNRGGLSARMRKGSILRCRRDNVVGMNDHPTRKPPALLRELIESSSCFGELVLDPFAGSGSTLEAAYLEGRRAIGLEIELNYCEVALSRLESLIPLDAPVPETNR